MASKLPFLLLSLLVMSAASMAAEAAVGPIHRNVDITWGEGRGRFLNNGQLSLSLDNSSGSGFQSKNQFLFGKFDMQIKLVPGNSAGTVVAYYLRSEGLAWDEIDFEFLGNLSGQPYVLHTNIYTRGKGDREQQFYLWFDPTTAFHTYSVLWNPSNIIIYVDHTPIRVFKNSVSVGVPYLKSQPMKIFGSIWNADDWATRGGLVKTDWTLAPFKTSFRNLNYDACTTTRGNKSSCRAKPSKRFLTQKLDISGRNRLRAVQSKYMIYNYCVDRKRFPMGLPVECTLRAN